MRPPRITSASARDHYQLIVEFDNGERRQYDVTPLLNRDPFTALRDLTLFKAVKIETGGYALIWNEHIDLSEYEVWRNSRAIH